MKCKIERSTKNKSLEADDIPDLANDVVGTNFFDRTEQV